MRIEPRKPTPPAGRSVPTPKSGGEVAPNESASTRADDVRSKLADLGLGGGTRAPITTVDTTITAADRARLTPEQSRAVESVVTNARAGGSPRALLGGPDTTTRLVAAKSIAADLGRPLVRVSSKYIGETEKNLDAVLGHAGRSEAVLFFDEADALFGKRTGVKDSHDKYANQEVSYLLDRLETYDGVAILTTNLPTAVDAERNSRFDALAAFLDSD